MTCSPSEADQTKAGLRILARIIARDLLKARPGISPCPPTVENYPILEAPPKIKKPNVSS